MASGKQAALGFIFVTLLIDTIGFGIIIPVMPNLIMELGRVDNSHAALLGGWLLFAFAIAQFFCAPIMGGLSDRFGRRPVLLASLFGFGLDYIFLSFAPTIGWLFVGRVIAGMFGASFTTAAAYIADVSPPEKRGQNFGMIGAAFGVGFVLGPAIGGLLGELGHRAPFIAAASLSLINCIYGYFVLPESLKEENRRKFDWKRANPVGSLYQLRKYPLVLSLAGSLMLIYIAAHAVQGNWSFYVIEKFKWGSAMIGASLAAVGILIGVVQGWLIRLIIPAWGQKKALFIGLILYCVGFFLFAFATQGWMAFAILIPYCLGSISGAAMQGIISTQVPANEQGELQGAMTSLVSLTSIIGPLLMSILFSYYTSDKSPVYFPGAPMLAGFVLTLISLLLAMKILSNYHESKQQAQPVDQAPVH